MIDYELLIKTKDDDLLDTFPNYTRGELRRIKRDLLQRNIANNFNKDKATSSITKELKKLIDKKKMSVIELSNVLNVSPKTIQESIKELEKEHYVVDVFNDSIQAGTEIKPSQKPSVIDFQKYKEIEYPIGFVADTHIGSKYERLDVINALYDRFEKYGVKEVYHGGNMIDGEARFNKFDIYVNGIEAQVKNFIEKYPQRNGITTSFVTGDDHEGWYVQREHINIGNYIVDESKKIDRKDLVHLGYIEHDLQFKQKGGSSSIRVIHAGGGSSYALSYSSQKYAESLQGGEKPSIVLVGHFHKFDYSYPREIHMIQGGCTQDQTPFMRKRKIQSMVGGVVLWVKQSERGIFTSVKVEWIPFYDKKYYVYKW